MSEWGYGHHTGPESWSKYYPNAAGEKQSPIDIKTTDAVYDKDICGLDIQIDKDKSHKQILEDHGHFFYLRAPDALTIEGGPARNLGKFKFVQLHFHWGKSEEQGSEHLLDGRSFPSEMHMVHYNANRYKSPDEALSKEDGFLVLGVLIKIGDKNLEFEKLIKPLQKMRSSDKKINPEEQIELNFKNILPKNTEKYFTYPGSLTTPPCNECVTWVVFKENITMSFEQLSKFRNIHTGDKCQTQENFRPVCPLNNRKVKKSFQ